MDKSRMFQTTNQTTRELRPSDTVGNYVEQSRTTLDDWNPINNGMFTTYQLLQDFATIHSMWGKQKEKKQGTYNH